MSVISYSLVCYVGYIELASHLIRGSVCWYVKVFLKWHYFVWSTQHCSVSRSNLSFLVTFCSIVTPVLDKLAPLKQAERQMTNPSQDMSRTRPIKKPKRLAEDEEADGETSPSTSGKEIKVG